MARIKETAKTSKVATGLEAMLKEGRERRRNEDLAKKILGAGRRTCAGPSTAAGSLTGRAGVRKTRASTGALPDKPATLAARMAFPGTKKAKKIAAAIERAKTTDAVASQVNMFEPKNGPPANAPKGPKQKGPNGKKPAIANSTGNVPSNNAFPVPPANQSGFSIRGLAGPFVVIAQNFAEGTTAADIESAMSPIGGLIVSCCILKIRPIIIAEVVFESREGAERVIKQFNNQTADGRILQVEAKVGGPTGLDPGSFSQAQPRKPVVVDGSLGFDDPMEMDDKDSAGGLYSDNIVPAQRKGRGFQAWKNGSGNGSGRSMRSGGTVGSN